MKEQAAQVEKVGDHLYLVWNFLYKLAIMKGYWTILDLHSTQEPLNTLRSYIHAVLLKKKYQSCIATEGDDNWEQQEGDYCFHSSH